MFRSISHFNPNCSRLISATLTACVLFLTLEVPIPIRVVKVSTTSYPCQSRPCGCDSADQCWEDCCCFSDTEKLAWAVANDIQPPAWFVRKMNSVVSVHVDCKSQKRCCCVCESNNDSTASGLNLKTNVTLLSIVRKRQCDGQDQMVQKQAYFQLVLSTLAYHFTSWPLGGALCPIWTAISIEPPTPPPRLPQNY
jgi:hypothetical protein